MINVCVCTERMMLIDASSCKHPSPYILCLLSLEQPANQIFLPRDAQGRQAMALRFQQRVSTVSGRRVRKPTFSANLAGHTVCLMQKSSTKAGPHNIMDASDFEWHMARENLIKNLDKRPGPPHPLFKTDFWDLPLHSTTICILSTRK